MNSLRVLRWTLDPVHCSHGVADRAMITKYHPALWPGGGGVVGDYWQGEVALVAHPSCG